ncbi:hypothetical protein Hte_003969 [Hypoxylon texense]
MQTTGVIKTLKPAEAELLNTVLRNAGPSLKGTVDWNAVTNDANYKSRKVTLTIFADLCRKHNWLKGNNAAQEPQAADDTAGNHSRDVPQSSPKKRRRIVKAED